MASGRVTRRMHRRSRSLVATVGIVAVCAVAGACGGDPGASESTGLERLDPGRVGPQGRVAQFVVECELSHVAYDDPIVHPGDAGASHLHTFFGNADVDADPDYDRIAGADTSCEQRRDTASYWAPALLDTAGSVVEPVSMTGYYRPGFGVDPAAVEPYPAGLMMVAGDALATATQPIEVVSWSCGTSAVRDTTPSQCPASSTLRLLVNFPDCWDGERLRGSERQPVEVTHHDGGMTMLMQPAPVDHTAYSVDGRCPAAQPVPIPMLQLAIDYPPVAPSGLSLASGEIVTAHADFWNVWDQDKLEQEVDLCINADRVCGVTS
jgi:hypothetical protein